MKKNISINISGIIFHIEEDGFDRLKAYLESINRYFSSFEDNKEIIADIESRIAEIFLNKLNEGRQVVTADDVDTLIATLGTVADFEAIEEVEDLRGESSGTYESTSHDTAESTDTSEETYDAEEEAGTGSKTSSTRVYRDEKRKLLGGVAAGFAHYLNIDPLWIRLLLVLLVLGFSFGPPISGTLVIAYILCWIILPGTDDLEEDKSIKKLYRDANGNVFGGVASGLAAYFAVDVTIMRLLFVVTTIFGGLGLIAYLVLWVITPEAKSLTERMEMKGEPVTLSNIETKLKDSLKAGSDKEDEGLFVRIFLFPFRMLSVIFAGLGRMLGPIVRFMVDIIRIFIGAIISITGLSLFIAFLVIGGILLGIETVNEPMIVDFDNYKFPLEFFIESISTGVIIAFIIALLIPAFAVILIGLVVIAQRRLLSSSVAWTIFSVWVIALLVLSFSSIDVVRNFQEEGRVKETQEFALSGETAYLQINENGPSEISEVELFIASGKDSVFVLETRYYARGATNAEAEEHAREAIYKVRQQDSLLIFDSNFDFAEGATFAGHQVKMTLRVPENRPFVLERGIGRIIDNNISSYRMRNNTWIFNEKGLQCLDCGDSDTGDDRGFTVPIDGNGEWDKVYSMDEFRIFNVEDRYNVTVVKGDRNEVRVRGSQEWLDRTEVRQEGNIVYVDYAREGLEINFRDFDVEVYVITNALDELIVDDRCEVLAKGFSGKDITVRVDDRSVVTIDADYESLTAYVTDRSTLRLIGKGTEIDARVDDRSALKAGDYVVETAYIKATDRSRAKVYAKGSIKIDRDRRSSVSHDGTAEVTEYDRN